MPKFRNKNGDLSYYSFACGYIQRETKGELYKDMFMEHEHFHVKAGKHGQKWTVWEVFESNELTKARKLFRLIELTDENMGDFTQAIDNLFDKGMIVENVIDRVIERNGIIGVGLVSLADHLSKYVKSKIMPK